MNYVISLELTVEAKNKKDALNKADELLSNISHVELYDVEKYDGLLLCHCKDDEYRITGHFWHCPSCDSHLTSLGLCPECGTRYEFEENIPFILLRYAEIIQVVDKELRYCLENPDMAFHREYRKGFQNGLIQAKYLITQLATIDDRRF